MGPLRTAFWNETVALMPSNHVAAIAPDATNSVEAIRRQLAVDESQVRALTRAWGFPDPQDVQ